jgi:hypothetical protein
VKNRTTVTGGTVLGELRVSRWLLEQAMPSAHRVTSFRPGVLANPFQLPQALEATGFTASSSMTANNALTHLPLRLSRDRAGAAESRVWEFPVSIEDEEKPPMLQRLDQALALARNVARYHGELIVLIHPTESTGKLQFAEGLVTALQDSAHFSTIGNLGRWWAARAALQMAVTRQDSAVEIALQGALPIEGLALEVPTGWTLEPTDGVTQRGGTIVVAALSGERRLRFRVPSDK